MKWKSREGEGIRRFLCFEGLASEAPAISSRGRWRILALGLNFGLFGVLVWLDWIVSKHIHRISISPWILWRGENPLTRKQAWVKKDFPFVIEHNADRVYNQSKVGHE